MRAMPLRYSLDITRYNRKSSTSYIAANASRRSWGGRPLCRHERNPRSTPVAGCRFPVPAVVFHRPGPRSLFPPLSFAVPVPGPWSLFPPFFLPFRNPKSEIRNVFPGPWSPFPP